MAAVVQRFPFPAPTSASLAPARASSSWSWQGGAVPSQPSGGDNRNGGANMRWFCLDEPPCFGAARKMLAAMTRSTPASLYRQAGRSELPRFDRFGARQVETEAEDVVLPICSLPLSRQLGQAIGRESRKRWLFRAKCPPPPSLALAIVTEGEDPQGLRESPKAANRARPEGERQIQPLAITIALQSWVIAVQRFPSKLEGSASLASAKQPTKMPPEMQEICRQTGDGMASAVTPCTSA
jgi:hypothetical protein